MREEDASRGMRLQKFLSRAGVASRREAEGWIDAGRIRVNGEVVTVQGTRVRPGRDRVEVDGEEVTLPPTRWLLLHKPRGAVTTRKDPRGRETVYHLLPKDAEGLVYVGRLDRDTEGLLLFTNDGEAVHALLHPSSEVPREYRAVVEGVVEGDTVERLRKGVELEDGLARGEAVRTDPGKGRTTRVSLILREGRKREVRRLLEAVGHPVRRLKRVRFGSLRLGDLPPGRWRELDGEEVAALRRTAGLKEGE